ncbi:MAG TPA: serine hydrolase [Candidatus Limnocylindria bacterium]|nr:serine hydrolase [Candidatus Limnocylindria bacterium]
MQDKVQKLVEELRAQYGLPSIAASVHFAGETFFCCDGFADMERKVPATPDTIYPIASTSKSFAATALCILADEGKLKLDDKIRQHLPEFVLLDESLACELTIRDALTHRTGLPRHDLMWMILEETTVADVVHRMRYLPSAFPLRTRMQYQNHMFVLASHLVEKITGTSWHAFIREKILAPLGMDSTFPLAGDYRGKGLDAEAMPYGDRGDGPKRIPYLPSDHVAGAGCISSTVRDMDKWARLHLNRGELDGVRIFSEEMAREMHSPQTIIKPGEFMPPGFEFDEIDFPNYGMGWFVESYRGHKFVHHGGTVNGFESLAGFLPREGLAFCVLTNLDGNMAPSAFGYLVCDLALGLSEIDWGTRWKDATDALLGQMRKATEDVDGKLRDAAPLPREAKDYAGAYTHPGYGRVAVEEAEGGLAVRLGPDRCTLKHLRHGQFFLDYGDGRAWLPVKFDCDMDGGVCKAMILLESLTGWIEFEKEVEGQTV